MSTARIEKVVISGVFSLDGQDFDVDNNVWLVGDDDEVLVIDAPHDAAPIVEAVGGRRVTAIVLTHGHNDHISAAVALRDAVGHPAVYEQAFYSRDLAGTVVLVGVPNPTMEVTLPMIEVFGRGGALKSSWYGDCLPSRDFPMLIDLYLQGRFDLDAFVSETIGLDDVEAAFEKMHSGDVLRSVVSF